MRAGIFFLLFLTFIPVQLFARVELKFWHFWKPAQVNELIAEFEKHNPQIDIKPEQLTWKDGRTKIILSIAGEVAPDVFELGSTWASRFAMDGALLSVKGQINRKDFHMLEPVILKTHTASGTVEDIFGFSWIVGPRALFFNKTLIKDSGVKYFERGPENWDELIEISEKVYKPNDGIYGFGVGKCANADVQIKRFLPFIWSKNLKLFNEKKQFQFFTPPFQEVILFYKKLAQFSTLDSQDIMDQLFLRGKLALHISGPWLLPRIKKVAPGLKFGVCLMPKPEGGEHRSFIGGEVLVAWKKTKYPKEAITFIKFMTAWENASKFCQNLGYFFPAKVKPESAEAISLSPALDVFQKQIPGSVHPPNVRHWVGIQKIIMDTVDRVLRGEEINAAFNKGNKDYLNLKTHTTRPGPGGKTALTGLLLGCVVLFFCAFLLYFFLFAKDESA
ncbi:extracellular solute-binding protein [Candidatus Riflebacteria bacterium]